MTARVNGVEWSRADLDGLWWSFAEMLVYASEAAPVRRGDVLGSGTCGTGCILELSLVHGAERYPYLQPGDEVELEVAGLGVLANRVVAGDAPGFAARPRAHPPEAGPVSPARAPGGAGGRERRLLAAAGRIRASAVVLPDDALTDPDPDSGERWDRGQVLAHVAEMLPYWAQQAELIAAGRQAEFGRVKSDPDRSRPSSATAARTRSGSSAGSTRAWPRSSPCWTASTPRPWPAPATTRPSAT